MKKKTRVISLVLATAMVVGGVFSLTGCKKEEVVEEDVVTKINVTSEELAPEITDEDLGIVRKDPEELMKITGYQSWEGYNFLIMTTRGGTGDSDVTVQIEDEELFNSLYNARLRVYVEPSYTSVSQDDPMYSAYAKGLRSLGDEFYAMMDKEQSSVPASEESSLEETEEVESTDEETTTEETEADTEADTETKAEENEPSNEEAVEEEETETVEETVEEETTEETEEDSEEEESSQSYESLLNGGLQDIGVAEEEHYAQLELNSAIQEYMETVSLNRATQILVYALDGELLGSMTAAKLDDYIAAFEIEATPYDTEDGTVYISDLEDGVEYEVHGLLYDEAGNYEYMFKNDSKKPVTIYLTSETVNKEEVIFQNYMETSSSTGWYLKENQYGFVSTDETFHVRVEHKNSDADLAASLPAGKVLTITEKEMSDKIQVVESDYSAVVNDTDYTIYITADTGDELVLGSKQAYGIHKSAYDTLTYMFEGATADRDE